MAFEVRIPTGKGDGGGAKGGADETNKLLKKLDKTMILNIDVNEIITSLFKDLVGILRPLFKIISILFLLAFLPLLPLFVLLIKGLALLVKLFTGGFGNVGEMIGKIIIGILLIALAFFLAPFITGAIAVGIVIGLLVLGIMFLADGIAKFVLWIGGFVVEAAQYLWGVFLSLGAMLWNGITFIGNWFKEAATWLWEKIKTGFENVINFGGWIWDLFVDGLQAIAGIGQMIVDAVANALKNIGGGALSLGRRAIKAINPFDDFIQRPGQSPTNFSPQDTIIGMKDLSGLGGSTVINVNNPTVRDNADIRKMTDAISRELQKRGNRGFSI